MTLSLNSGAEAKLILRYPDEETTRAVVEAISPDNYEAPPGLTLSIEMRKTEIIISVKCPKGVGSLLATLDDLLSCLGAAEKTLQSLD
jgi:hypothetical protein